LGVVGDAVGVFAQIVGVIALVVTGLWAYIRFVLERGLLPPIEFTIDCRELGPQRDWRVVEILLHIKNLGVSTAVLEDLHVKMGYVGQGDQVNLFPSRVIQSEERAAKERKLWGQLEFPHRLQGGRPGWHDGKGGPEGQPWRSGLPVVGRLAYVRPGVDQICTFVTAVPKKAAYLHVLGSFKYDRVTKPIPNLVIRLGQHAGIIPYRMKDTLTSPHTAVRVFRLQEGIDAEAGVEGEGPPPSEGSQGHE